MMTLNLECENPKPHKHSLFFVKRSKGKKKALFFKCRLCGEKQTYLAYAVEGLLLGKIKKYRKRYRNAAWQ